MKRLFFITLSLLFILGCKNDSSDSPQTPVVTKTETPKEEPVEIKKEEPDIWSTPISIKDIQGNWDVQIDDVKYHINIYDPTMEWTFSRVYIPSSKIKEYEYLNKWYGYRYTEESSYYSKLILKRELSSWARKLQINQKLNKIKNAEFGSDVILIKQNY